MLQIESNSKKELPAEQLLYIEQAEKRLVQAVPAIELQQHRIPMENLHLPSQMNNEVESRNGHYEGTWTDDHGEREIPIESETGNSRHGNRGRTTYSDEQIGALEKAFVYNPYPNPHARQQLARNISVPEGKIKIWFQNRRARAKKLKIASQNWKSGGKEMHCSKLSNQRHNEKQTKTRKNHTKPPPPMCDTRSNCRPPLHPHSSLSLSNLSLRNNECASATQSLSSNNPDVYQASFSEAVKPNFNHCGESRTRTKEEKKLGLSDTYPSQFPVIENGIYGAAHSNSSLHKNMAMSYHPSLQPSALIADWASCEISSFKTHDMRSKRNDEMYRFSKFRNDGINVTSSAHLFSPRSTQPTTSSLYELSPPPIRRFVFPLDTIINEEEKRNFGNVAKSSKMPDKFYPTTTNYNPPMMNHKETLSINTFSDCNYLPTADSQSFPQTTAEYPFNLHGMDYRHNPVRALPLSDRSWENFPYKEHYRSHGSSNKTELPSMSLRNCYQQENSPLQSQLEHPEVAEWPCQKVDLPFLDQEKMFVAPGSRINQEDKTSEWLLYSGSSSASVLV